MASTIICLATNQKFNFSEYIFDNMVKHLDGGVKFLMYPRFVQVFLDSQVECMDRHNAIFVISFHTKKVFANMKREGKDFSEKVTPLFQSMMVQALEDIGEGLKIPTDPHNTPIVTQPSSSLPQKKQKSKRKQKKEIEVPSPSSEIPNKEGVSITSNDPLPSEEVKTAQAKKIASLKKRVKKLEQKMKSRTSGLKRLRKVRTTMRVKSSTEVSSGDHEDASKQERMIDNIDQDVDITIVDDIQGRMNEEDMFGVNDLDGDEVVVDVSASVDVEQSVKVVEKEVSAVDPVTTGGEVVTTAGIEVTTAATSPQISKDKLTLAQTLIEIKAAKPKAITTATTTVTAVGLRPKEKGIMQAELEEEVRLARLKEEETNIALFVEWDNIQDMMDADCELAVRLQEEESGELSIEEKSRHNQLNNKSFKEIQMLFNNTIKWIEAFVPIDTELVKDSDKAVKGSDKAVEGSEKAEEYSSKRAGSNLE
uniref:Uncharacterized protein n=1 Tax=Tanacetum cinerariifolium TaxID=118510 RepID=A0A699I0Q7_TANCI|nr:hypothetical protein [Tanacetum cinerariifolium]